MNLGRRITASTVCARHRASGRTCSRRRSVRLPFCSRVAGPGCLPPRVQVLPIKVRCPSDRARSIRSVRSARPTLGDADRVGGRPIVVRLPIRVVSTSASVTTTLRRTSSSRPRRALYATSTSTIPARAGALRRSPAGSMSKECRHGRSVPGGNAPPYGECCATRPIRVRRVSGRRGAPDGSA